jgi:hypothetical protein
LQSFGDEARRWLNLQKRLIVNSLNTFVVLLMGGDIKYLFCFIDANAWGI